MDQFSEPLLCFRELVQNSVDAEAKKIEIKTGYDKDKQLLEIQVIDDGAGMSLDNIRTYLTLFDSTKDTNIKKIGQMGAGKVFAHALKPKLMTVETGNGEQGYRVVFNPDLSGKILETTPHEGTNVRLFIPMKLTKARAFNKKLEEVVGEWCKYIKTPLFINGQKINEPFKIKGDYVERIEEEGLEAEIAFKSFGYEFFKGGILLEKTHYLYSRDNEKGDILSLFGGLVNAERVDFPISRNGVVRNEEYYELIRTVKKNIVKKFTPRFIDEIKDKIDSKKIIIDQPFINRFFHHILANNGYGWLDRQTLDRINQLPILENADGSFLSVNKVKEKAKQQGYLYYLIDGSFSATELSAFLDNDIPVLRKPEMLVREDIFKHESKQCLDNGYYKGYMSERFGVFNFSRISDLLTRGFVSKISLSSTGGGFLGTRTDNDGNFDNPFDFSKLRIYGADFKDFQGNPQENILLDSYWDENCREHSVILNVSHPFMKSMRDLALKNQRLAYYFIACELIKSKKVFDNASARLRENEMLRIGLKAVDNE